MTFKYHTADQSQSWDLKPALPDPFPPNRASYRLYSQLLGGWTRLAGLWPRCTLRTVTLQQDCSSRQQQDQYQPASLLFFPPACPGPIPFLSWSNSTHLWPRQGWQESTAPPDLEEKGRQGRPRHRGAMKCCASRVVLLRGETTGLGARGSSVGSEEDTSPSRSGEVYHPRYTAHRHTHPQTLKTKRALSHTHLCHQHWEHTLAHRAGNEPHKPAT